jgi:O-succinylbenzoic acid--CoA ligase
VTHVALTFESKTWSWPEVDAAVAGWVQWLAAHQVTTGSRVAVTSFNRPEVLFVFLACAELGATFVPINARLTESERGALVAQVAPVVHLVRFEAVALVTGRSWSLASADLGTTAAALFTSGTTGEPKLIELTHGNFAANARATAANLGGSEHDSWLGTLPLFHIGGLAMAYRWALTRAHLALEAQFDALKVSAWLESSGITHASLVPTTLDRVLEANAGRGFSPKVRAVLIGGGPMGVALLSRARVMGLPVLQTYGLTEACSQVTTERLGEADGETAGPPLNGTEVRIVNGEIQVRGPTVAGPPGRWLETGDLGALDSRNRLTVFSRRVDLIITGGENVYPAEVEKALAAHPAIREVVVVPCADAKWGQVPVALVVWRGAPQPILAWARGHVASFKLPRAVMTLDAVPRNANGKVERRALVELAISGRLTVTETEA